MLMLESLPDGLVYQNIYLRMCLLSLKNDGALTFKNMLPYDLPMLSTVLHIDMAKMKMAIELFEKLGLVTKNDSEVLFMTDIQTLIGKSSTEAERIASYRKRISDGSTKSVQMLQTCTPKIEIELKTELEKEIKTETESDVEPSKTKKKKSEKPKHKVGTYKNVLLTEDEQQKLCEKLGAEKTNAVVNNYSELKEMKGYKYNSDYLAILKWGIRAYEEELQKQQKKNPQYKNFDKQAVVEKDFFSQQ
jgi:predicted phage replisome organizer